MPKSEVTKNALANALKQLMRTKPFAKVYVGDIVSLCGVNRQTFYYHFKDKFDLARWIFETETAQFLNDVSSLEEWQHGLCGLCRYLQENKRYYLSILSVTDNSLLFSLLMQRMRQITYDLFSQKRSVFKDEHTFQLAVDYCTVSVVGMIAFWVSQDMPKDLEQDIGHILTLLDGSLLREVLNS